MNLTQGLHRAVQQHPDGIATVCAGRTSTHARVRRPHRPARGRAAGHWASRTATAPRSCRLNSDRYHEFLAATLWAGGVVVPVNLRWSIAEIAESLAEVDARVLVVDDAFAGHVDGHPRGPPEPRARDPRRRRPATRTATPSFEQLVADHEPVAGRPPRRRRSGRRLLHRRHHRPVQGRHAQPRQPAHLGARRAGQRALPQPRRHLPARRADVPPGRPRRLDLPARPRRHPRR